MRRRGLKITALVFSIICVLFLPLIYIWTYQTYEAMHNVVIPTGEIDYGKLGYLFLLIAIFFLYCGIGIFTIITFSMSLTDVMKTINEGTTLKNVIPLLVVNSILLIGIILFIPVCRIFGGMQ